MVDLDTLRPEVREAVHAIDHGNGVFVDSDDGIGAEKWRIVRAELLRLADENARLRERVSDTEHFRDVHIRAAGIFRKRAEAADAELAEARKNETVALGLWNAAEGRATKAEAELAALKARIAEAPVYEIPLSKPKSEDGWARVIESVKNERSVRGKRVRLVVEE